MKSSIVLSFLIVIFVLVLSACGSKAPPTLAWTPPAVTASPQGIPSATPTKRAGMPLGERQMVVPGGYSIQTPINLNVKISADQAIINNADSTIRIILGLTPRKNPTQKMELALTNFLYNRKEIQNPRPGKPFPATIAGKEGLALDFTGSILKVKGAGELLFVEMGQDNFFYAYAFTADGAEGDGWEREGKKTLEAILGSLRFDH